VQLQRLERHLNAQQATALEMPHCARGWMQRAAEERALAARPPGILPATTVHCPLRAAVRLLPATYYLTGHHHLLPTVGVLRPESEEAGGFRESSQALSRLCGVLLTVTVTVTVTVTLTLTLTLTLTSQALSRLCGVLLNGCRTERIGRRIIVALGAVQPCSGLGSGLGLGLGLGLAST
jgi:hypothetical protein